MQMVLAFSGMIEVIRRYIGSDTGCRQDTKSMAFNASQSESGPSLCTLQSFKVNSRNGSVTPVLTLKVMSASSYSSGAH